MTNHVEGPLNGLTIVELSSGAGAAYAGRLLSTLGAHTVLAEPPGGSLLRHRPPFLPPSGEGAGEVSALFAYLAAGKASVVCDLATVAGREDLHRLLETADAFICDVPLAQRAGLGVDEAGLRATHPHLIHVSVLPYGASGPHADWHGEEINLIHASGEGFLLPNGLSAEMFPDRPPLKIHGHFAEMQGGVVAALGALAALLASRQGEGTAGEAVDVSIQDAALAVGAFAIQRLGDGSLEHRLTRSFKYGGVLECADGYVQLLTLEERQWTGLVELMGRPGWATAPDLADPLERSRRGAEINERIRAWSRTQLTADVVARAQTLGVPMGKYASPAEVLAGAHEAARGLFQSVDIPGAGPADVLVAPFHLDGGALRLRSGPPALGEHQSILSGNRRREAAPRAVGAR
ncbi:CoA transferase [Azorhizobium oxalatiphilum]|uniref:CoA transferase n=1 Tax=Azorhizobium oxalatiphilum TaxID=980631 RepID=A0A917F7J7_9HYPH|nr:CoA transferase [Azorhizobium oxalatiphilum]GGF51344.1 CoA transferase [Azorhizobium oxalatiphilum]